MHEVQTEITAADVSAWERHAAARTAAGSKRRSFTVLVVVWGVLAVFFTWGYTTTKWPPGYILSCGIGIAIGWVLAAWARSASVEGAADNLLSLAGELTYAIGDGVLEVRAAMWQLSLRREAIRAVEDTPEHFFVSVEPASVLIVPKRAFASAEEAAAFRRGLGVFERGGF